MAEGSRLLNWPIWWGKARNTIQKRLDSMPVNHLIVEKKGKTNFYKLDLLMFKESGSRLSV